jgi:hypothetical protein
MERPMNVDGYDVRLEVSVHPSQPGQTKIGVVAKETTSGITYRVWSCWPEDLPTWAERRSPLHAGVIRKTAKLLPDLAVEVASERPDLIGQLIEEIPEVADALGALTDSPRVLARRTRDLYQPTEGDGE